MALNSTYENYTEYESSSERDAHIIAENIQKYSKPFICLFGSVGNILSTIIFLSKSQTKTSCSLYLAARSLSDTGFLISLFCIWLGDMKVNAFKPPGMCQIVLFLSYVCAFLSVWFIVAVTFENYVRICLPMQVNVYCTTRQARIIIITVISFSVLLYSFTLWITASILSPTGMTICQPYLEYEDIYQYFIYIDVVVTLVIPTLITIFLMLPITVSLIESFRRQARLSKKSSRPVERRHTAQSIVTKMLFCVSLSFIILSLPSHVIRLELTISTFVKQETSLIEYTTTAIKYIFETIYNLSFAINFMIYLLFGEKFRTDFQSRFCIRYFRRREQSTQTVLSLNNTRSRLSCNGENSDSLLISSQPATAL